jgi:hypothetical protein
MGIDRSDGGKFKINRGGAIGDNDGFTLTRAGNVGIGTPNPQATLDVQGTINNAFVSKAWVTFDGNTAPYNVIRDRANVASVVYEGGWTWKINWANSFGNTNYAVIATASSGPVRLLDVQATYARIQSFSISSTPEAAPAEYVSVIAYDN